MQQKQETLEKDLEEQKSKVSFLTSEND